MIAAERPPQRVGTVVGGQSNNLDAIFWTDALIGSAESELVV